MRRSESLALSATLVWLMINLQATPVKSCDNVIVIGTNMGTVVDVKATDKYSQPLGGETGFLSESPPGDFELYPAYPNPFNNTTVLSFQLQTPGWVKLDVFDVDGRTVGAVREPPLRGRWYPAGPHQIIIDGLGLPSGIYIVHLKAGDFVASTKIVLLK